MKKTIEICEVTKTKTLFQVELPIYRKRDVLVDGRTKVIFIRWDGTTQWSVQRNDSFGARGSEVTWEIERAHRSSFSPAENADFVLGRCNYASSAEEFEAAVNEALTFLASFKEMPEASVEGAASWTATERLAAALSATLHGIEQLVGPFAEYAVKGIA